MTSHVNVADNAWHEVTLVRDAPRQTLYVDGVKSGELALPIQDLSMRWCQVGDAYTEAWPNSTGSWMPFNGSIKRVKVLDKAMSPEEVQKEYLSHSSLREKTRTGTN